jgi:ECF transporter S component (folate family)
MTAFTGGALCFAVPPFMKPAYEENGGFFMRKFFGLHGVFTTRNLVIMALMVALKVALSQFTIFATMQFKAFNLDYLPGAMVAALYGPWAGLAYGFVADTAGYFARPVGAYSPFYAISEMTMYFIYACFTYQQTISYLKVAAARVLIMVIVIFGMNFLWGAILYGSSASGFFTSVRLINNLIQLPVYVFLSAWCAKLARRLETQTRRA